VVQIAFKQRNVTYIKSESFLSLTSMGLMFHTYLSFIRYFGWFLRVPV